VELVTKKNKIMKTKYSHDWLENCKLIKHSKGCFFCDVLRSVFV
jgi:hypothetical protein